MSDLYGFQVKHNSNLVVSTTDRLARIVGFHDLKLSYNTTYKNTFHHPELQGMGDLFYWFSHTGFWQIEVKGSIVVSGTSIIVDIKVIGGSQNTASIGDGKLYYGVK